MRLILTVLILMTSSLAFAQQVNPLPIVRQKMEALKWLSGKWHGTAYLNGRNGNRQEVSHNLEFSDKLNSTVFFINESAVLVQDTIFQNIGFLGYNVQQSQYNLQAFTNSGVQMDAYVEVLDNKMIWRFHAGGHIYKYTANLDDKGQWHQIGEVSADEGKKWEPFFESILNRIE